MIITNNEEALRVFCHPVAPDEVNDLIFTLENELEQANRLGKSGIGLAAPQIGINKNIAIIRLGNGVNLNLINVKLEKGFDPAIFTQEGCLSFPGRVEDTTRFQEVYITNNLVEPNSFIATGLLAVIKKKKVGPNDLCICNSGVKYKKCCGKNK